MHTLLFDMKNFPIVSQENELQFSSFVTFDVIFVNIAKLVRYLIKKQNQVPYGSCMRSSWKY